MVRLVMITAREGSSRLPNKVTLPFGGYDSLVAFVFDRSTLIANSIVTVCTGPRALNPILSSICQRRNIPIFHGAEKNKVLRWAECIEAFQADVAHGLDCDDPFFDWDRVSESLEMSRSSNLITLPSLYSDGGGATEGVSFTADAINEFVSEDSNREFEMIYEPFSKSVNGVGQLSDPPYAKKGVRMTVDYQADFEFLSHLGVEFGSCIDRKELEALIPTPTPNFSWNSQWKSNQRKITSLEAN